MDYLEINEIGNFHAWPPGKIRELEKSQVCDSLGQNLLFENKNMLLWEVTLLPGERLPFRKVNRDNYWVSLTDGLAITRSSNGRISMIRFNKGETMFFDFEGNADFQDLENIGDEELSIHVIELKSILEKVPDTLTKINR